MYSMYIVHAENETERGHLQVDFLQNSGQFAVPFSHVNTLNGLIGETCCEFFQKDESIFIEKLKNLISGIVNFSFSFPLWREILSQLKRKDTTTESYRKYLVGMDKLFLEERVLEGFENTDDDNHDWIDYQFQKTLKSFKSLDIIDIDQPSTSFTSFQKISNKPKTPQKKNQINDKLSVQESVKTNDKSVNLKSQKINLGIKSSHKIQGDPISFANTTPIRILQENFETQLAKFSQSANGFDKNTAKTPRISMQRPLKMNQQNQFEDFLNSFKKQRASPVADMILKDQSLSQVVKKQKVAQKEKRILQEQLYEKTKTVKSKQYNKNIKSILLNRKVKDKKKTAVEGPKSRISGVIGAYELRRMYSEVIHFDEESNLRLFKSTGKSFFNLNK